MNKVDDFLIIRKISNNNYDLGLGYSDDNLIRIFIDKDKYLKCYNENDIKFEKYKFLGSLITIKIFENYKNFIEFDEKENLNLNYFDYELLNIDAFKADMNCYVGSIDIEKELCAIFIYECKDKLLKIIEEDRIVKNNLKYILL